MVDIQLDTGATVRIDVVGPSVFRIRTSVDANFALSPLERYRLVRFPDPDDSVEVEPTDATVTIRTATTTLVVDRRVGRILAHQDPGGPQVHIDPQELSFTLGEDDRLYGLGDASRDSVNRRGRRLDMWVRNVASYVPIPQLMNSAGWGIFVNSTRRLIFDVGSSRTDQLRITGAGSDQDVTLFLGDFAQQLDDFTAITGRPALLPMRSYGLTFVCNQSADARELLDDAQRFRAMDIPCDTIGLEPGWMSERYDYTTAKTWHPERFYLPSWMLPPAGETHAGGLANTFLGAVDRLGFRLSLWLCCDYDLSHEAERRALDAETAGDVTVAVDDPDGSGDVENDARLQNPVLMDTVTDPSEPWFDHLKTFVDQGAGAFKLDGANQVMEHPDRLWGNGMLDDQMHNLYPGLLAQQMYEGFVEHTGRRAMVYSAAGYAGSAQYVATWAGDTGGGPGPLASMINLGLSGHSNTSCDMDVFTAEGIHFGFLQPWSQVCSWAYWRHPWLLGPVLEPIFISYANLRQRLLPYLYTAAHRAHTTGMPILRAMPLAFGDDAAASDYPAECERTQYLLGDDLLVGAFTERIWLPSGQWIDWWSGQRHVGPGWINAPSPEGRGGPLLVRAGAVIPTWPTQRTATQTPQDVEWLIHVGPDREAVLYEDDGDSLAHEQGHSARTTVSTRRVPEGLEITISPREGHHDGMPIARIHHVTVIGVGQTEQDDDVVRVTVEEADKPVILVVDQPELSSPAPPGRPGQSGSPAGPGPR